MLILSELTLYYFDCVCKYQISASSKLGISPSSKLDGPIPNWADKVASQAQLKPSAPPSTRTSKTLSHTADHDLDFDEAPEEYREPLTLTQRGKGIVHFVQKPKRTPAGKNRSLSTTKEPEYVAEEELEILEDPEAAEDEDEVQDNDMAMIVDDDDGGHTDCQVEASVTRHTSSMAVDISDRKTMTTNVKTEGAVSENHRARIRKGKPKNSHLPSEVLEGGKWRTTFLPCLMYWVGNSEYGWSIPDGMLSTVLDDIANSVYSPTEHRRDFDTESFAFGLACQRIHEWRAAFGSTAVSVLMAFFASTPEYQAQDARKEFAEYQLQDCNFIYEDPDNEEQPGAFLSEFILRVFAAHLSAIAGRVRVDALVEFGKPGYLTALALTAVAVERALDLVRTGLLVDCDPSENKKTHKIAQTLNEATNKMSHTGTAFSSGNWETDTMAYMESVKELPHSRIQEILTCAEEYMKHPRYNYPPEDDISGLDSSTPPANKRARLRI